jgi:hypothetical protein
VDEIQRGFVERGREAVTKGMELNKQQAGGRDSLLLLPLDDIGPLGPDDGEEREEEEEEEEEEVGGGGLEEAINAALSR